jgi:Ca2+-binding RTX toxin-like protein
MENSFLTLNDILEWISDWSEQHITEADIETDITSFARELNAKIAQMDFKATNGGAAIGYSGRLGNDGSTAIFRTISFVADGSNGEYSYINMVADNIQNQIAEPLRDAVGGDYADRILGGSEASDGSRLRTSFGDTLSINDLASDNFMLNNAKGDVKLIITETARMDSVLNLTEIERLLVMDEVTHINGIPKAELAGMTSEARFNLLKQESVLSLRNASIFEDAAGNQLLSFKDTQFESIFDIDIPEGYSEIGRYETVGKGVNGEAIFDTDATLRSKHPFLDTNTPSAVLDDLRAGEYIRRTTGVDVISEARLAFDANGKLIGADVPRVTSEVSRAVFDDIDTPYRSTVREYADFLSEADLRAKYNITDPLTKGELFDLNVIDSKARAINSAAESIKPISNAQMKEMFSIDPKTSAIWDSLSESTKQTLAYQEALRRNPATAKLISAEYLAGTDASISRIQSSQKGLKIYETLTTGKSVKVGGGILAVATIVYSGYQAVKEAKVAYDKGDATEGNRILARWGTTTAGSIGGSVIATELASGAAIMAVAIVGGPIGAAIGLGILIGAGIVGGIIGHEVSGSIFDKIWGFFTGAEAAQDVMNYDPIVLDLAGNGFAPTTVKDGAYFDLDQNGFAEKMGWTSGDDAFLAIDKNGNGLIDDGSELFGDKTKLSNGKYAKNGFEALKEYDTNGDGQIDANDADFANLMVWQDANGNGVSEDGELISLAAAGVVSISLGYKSFGEVTDSGTILGNIATFIKADGSEFQTAEYWVKSELYNTVDRSVVDVSEEIEALPDVKAMGTLSSLHKAMIVDETGRIKVLVERFIESVDVSERSSIVEQILMISSGAEIIKPTSRGSNFDAQKLHIIETLLGRPFNGVSGANPNVSASTQLKTVYTDLLDSYYSELALKTSLKPIIPYIYNATFDGKQYLDLTLLKAYLPQLLIGANESQILADIAKYLHVMKKDGYIGFEDFMSHIRQEMSSEYRGVAIAANAAIVGTDKNESLSASTDKTYVFAGAGNDTLNGSAGDDSLYGEDGNDYLYGNDGDDIIYGGAGNDQITGNNGDDYLDGGEGNDSLDGGAGNDVYVFGSGYGNDTVYDTSGMNKLRFTGGLAPEDLYVQASGNYDVVLVNRLTGERTTLYRFNYGPSYRNFVLEFDGIGEMQLGDVRSPFREVIGTDGSDNITSYIAGARFEALGGNDTVNGTGGDDHIDGGDGNDYLYGNDGDDIIYGGAGNDQITGDNGNDYIDGGEGNDTLSGGAGDDVYVFGAGYGNDTVQDTSGMNKLRFTGGLAPEDLYVQASGNYDVVLVNRLTGERTTLSYFRRYPEYRNFVLEFDDDRTATISANGAELLYEPLPVVEEIPVSNEVQTLSGETSVSNTTATAANDLVAGGEMAGAPDPVTTAADALSAIYDDTNESAESNLYEGYTAVDTQVQNLVEAISTFTDDANVLGQEAPFTDNLSSLTDAFVAVA